MKLRKLLSEIKLINAKKYNDIKNRIWEWYKYTETEDKEFEEWLKNFLNTFIGQDFTQNDFRKIWEKWMEKYSSGDVGMDLEYFYVTYEWILTGDDSVFDDIM